MEIYQKEIKPLLKELDTNLSGLSNLEANKRLKKYGFNTLPKEKKKNIFQIFIGEFIDPIILIMIVAIIFSFVIGEKIDGIAIIFIILVDAIMGTIQEWRASKSAESLEKIIKTKTRVIRDQKETDIDAQQLVPGDIVLLESGNKISADLRILESTNLTINEAVLTGESVAASKNNKRINHSIGLSEQENMAFAYR